MSQRIAADFLAPEKVVLMWYIWGCGIRVIKLLIYLAIKND